MREKKHEHNQITIRVSRITIVVNFALATGKALAGYFGHSDAMTADAVHAFSDVLGSVAVFIGALIADLSRNRDKKRLQDRIEGGISLALGCLLFYLAVEISINGIRTVLSGAYAAKEVPTLLPLVVAVVSIVIKEGLYRYSMAGARKADSVALRALAWHNRTDALVTAGSLAGIAGARLGYPAFDPLASVMIGIFVFAAACGIVKEALRSLRSAQ